MDNPPKESFTSSSNPTLKRTNEDAELDVGSAPLPDDGPSSSSSQDRAGERSSKMPRLEDAAEASMNTEEMLDGAMEVDVDVKGKGKARAGKVVEGDSVSSPNPDTIDVPDKVGDRVVGSAIARMADEMEQELWCGVS
jgi:hypothetical protein